MKLLDFGNIEEQLHPFHPMTTTGSPLTFAELAWNFLEHQDKKKLGSGHKAVHNSAKRSSNLTLRPSTPVADHVRF